MYVKRGMKLGDYDTAANEWTLSAWQLEKPQPKTHYVDKPNGDGAWDLSTALTDGVLRYQNRTLTATFECSEGNRLYREAKIKQMINQLDGLQINIVLPDDPDHYLVGRVQISKNYSDMAHCSVSLSAVCEPWKYSQKETIVTVDLDEFSGRQLNLINKGRRVVVPTLVVTAEDMTASVLIRYRIGVKVTSITVLPGTYEWADLQLHPGNTEIMAGTEADGVQMEIRYREAVLE